MSFYNIKPHENKENNLLQFFKFYCILLLYVFIVLKILQLTEISNAIISSFKKLHTFYCIQLLYIYCSLNSTIK